MEEIRNLEEMEGGRLKVRYIDCIGMHIMQILLNGLSYTLI